MPDRPVTRYALVPKAAPAEGSGCIRMRRFSLARVRVERLERVAWPDDEEPRDGTGLSAERDGRPG